MASAELKVTKTALALHLFCDHLTISNYQKLGIIERLDGKWFEQDKCREQVLRYLRKRSAGMLPREPGAPDPNREKALLARAQTRKIDFDLAQREGRVVDVEIVGRELELENRLVAERLMGIEVIADGLEPVDIVRREAIRATIHNKVVEVLSELSAPAALIDRAARSEGDIRPSEEGLSSTTESESDRLGGRVSPRRGKNKRDAGKVAH